PDKCLQHRRLHVQHVFSKRLNVKADGGLDIGHCLFICVAFADNHPFEAKRIGHITVGMLFNDDLQRFREPSFALVPCDSLGHGSPSTIWLVASTSYRPMASLTTGRGTVGSAFGPRGMGCGSAAIGPGAMENGRRSGRPPAVVHRLLTADPGHLELDLR